MNPSSVGCSRIRRELHEHHDGCPASPALATHLAECPACRELLLSLASLDSSLSCSIEPIPPVLARRLAASTAPRPEPLPRVLWMAAAGSLALAATLWMLVGDELTAPLQELAASALQAPAAALSQTLSPLLAWSWPVPAWLTDLLATPVSALDSWSRHTLPELLETSAVTLTLSLPLSLYPVGLVLAGSSAPARPRPRRRSA